jgi:hypothetical protein
MACAGSLADGRIIRCKSSVCSQIQGLIKAKFSWLKRNEVLKVSGSIPIFIKSFYAVKGDSYQDAVLYTLDMMSIVSHVEDKDPTTIFERLSFVQRFPHDKPANVKFLDELADSPTGFGIEPRGP